MIYPLIYWMLMALITVASAPRGLLGDPRRGLAQWHTPRIELRPSSSVPKAA